MVKAVLFDMNGVIIDDERIHEQIIAETLKPYNINLDHPTYLQSCVGRTDKACYEDLAKKFDADIPIDEILKTKINLYLEQFPKNKKAYPGVIELIKLLSKDFILGLTSSATRAEVDLILKEFEITNYFETTVSANDVKNGKPDPEPYILTAEKLGLNPNECVVIEDARNGVLSAKAAGCLCIAITNTHPKEDLEDADLIVDKFEEITPEIIKNLSLH